MNETIGEVNQSFSPINRRIPRREFERKRVAEAFDTAFELVGGNARLAVWAHENYGEFIKLYSRMLPTGTQVDINASGEIAFKHVLPPSKLDKLDMKE